MKTPEPTLLDQDYYPRIKHGRRWYLIVPEMEYDNPHAGCAFHCPTGRDDDECELIKANGGTTENLRMFRRHDCGDTGTIFVTPSKFPEYRAYLVSEKLTGDSND